MAPAAKCTAAQAGARTGGRGPPERRLYAAAPAEEHLRGADGVGGRGLCVCNVVYAAGVLTIRRGNSERVHRKLKANTAVGPVEIDSRTAIVAPLIRPSNLFFWV